MDVLKAIARIARLAITNPKRVAATVVGVLTGPEGECACCGYCGPFLPATLTPAWQCPKCLSLFRHRLLALAARRGFVGFRGLRVLHFAPEEAIARLILEQAPASYVSADLQPGRADIVLDLEAIDLEDGSVDMVVASHVLEHVDDRRALGEIARILAPGGRLVAMVPIIEGWAETYEIDGVSDAAAQTEHYGCPGHLRYYGRDFRDRVAAAGFALDEFTAEGADSVRYRLKRGTKVFLATKI
ncbi:MAG TPA: class I SAM-dependent methyltransferase [Allosphingosinicella sp.]|jgi:SAM-dependent methyltransferase